MAEARVRNKVTRMTSIEIGGPTELLVEFQKFAKGDRARGEGDGRGGGCQVTLCFSSMSRGRGF